MFQHQEPGHAQDDCGGPFTKRRIAIMALPYQLQYPAFVTAVRLPVTRPWGSRDADRDQAGTSAHPAATAPPQSIPSLRSASSWTPTQGWGIAARALGLRTSRNNERIHLEDMRDRTDRIHGVVSCFDWILFRNYLRSRAAERVADGSVRMIAPSVAILPNLNLLLSTPRVSLVPGLRPL